MGKKLGLSLLWLGALSLIAGCSTFSNMTPEKKKYCLIGAATGAIGGAVGRGFHASSIVAFGGVVTAARLLRLTDEQMAQAIGITATSVGGLSIGTNSWAREYHAGNAALSAVQAALVGATI